MRALRVITRIAFLETVRDRILWGYFVFALLMVVALWAVAKVPWGETHYLEGQLGYSAIALVNQVFVAVVAALQMGRDAERRVHYMILGRDIRRSAYLLGKFLGLWLTSVLMATLLVILLFALVTWEAAYRPPMYSLLGAIPAMALQSAMVLAVAMLLYQATTSTTLAMLLALLTVAIGRSVASVQHILENFGDAPRMVGKIAAYVFPNLELLTFNEAIIFERPVAVETIVMATLYAIAFAVALLALSIIAYDRKEL